MFLDSLFSTNKNTNFDFKLNANQRGQTCKFMPLLANISRENSTTADRGVPYGGLSTLLSILVCLWIDKYVKRI